MIGTALNVGYGFVYFWLLKRTEQSGAWWPIMIVGILLFIGIGFL